MWYPLEIPWASLVGQGLTGNDAKIGGAYKSGGMVKWTGGKCGHGFGKVGVAHEELRAEC